MTIVNFGEDGVKEVCGTALDSSHVSQTSQNVNNDEKFSDLFTNKGSSPKTSGSSSGVGSGNDGRNMCTNGQPYQFVIQKSERQRSNDPEYVGLCSSDNLGEKQKYVSVQGQNQSGGNLTIKVCSGSSCGQSSRSADGSQQTQDLVSSTDIHVLTSPSGTGGTQITFKKKN